METKNTISPSKSERKEDVTCQRQPKSKRQTTPNVLRVEVAALWFLTTLGRPSTDVMTKTIRNASTAGQ